MLPLRKNPERLKRYNDIFKEQQRTVVIEKDELPEKIRENNYLTQHGVVHDDKATTKHRIVFMSCLNHHNDKCVCMNVYIRVLI